MIISPGELAVGQFVTIYEEVKKEREFDDFAGRMPSKYYGLFGVPLEVLSVCLPYAVCKYASIAYILGLFGGHKQTSIESIMSLDTRECLLMEVSKEFLNAYVNGLKPPEQKENNCVTIGGQVPQ